MKVPSYGKLSTSFQSPCYWKPYFQLEMYSLMGSGKAPLNSLVMINILSKQLANNQSSVECILQTNFSAMINDLSKAANGHTNTFHPVKV